MVLGISITRWLGMIMLLMIPCLPAHGKTIDLYVMAGQSNAWGNGDATLLPAAWQAPHATVIYNGSLQDKLRFGPELASWGPLAPRTGHRYGPEIAFGWTLSGDAAIFHFVLNGSSIFSWLNIHLTDMFTAMDLAVDDLAGGGHQVRYAGMVWNQGEGDARRNNTATVYAERLVELIGEVRRHTGEPSLPFVLAQLHADNKYQYAPLVRDQQVWVANHEPGTWMVNVDDVQLGPDEIHYGQYPAWITLGQRYARAFVVPVPRAVWAVIPLLVIVGLIRTVRRQCRMA